MNTFATAHEDHLIPDLVATNLDLVVQENARLVARLDPDRFRPVPRLIDDAWALYFTGAGRSGLVMKAAAMRMMHLGRTAHVVGESTTPAITEGCLLWAASGSGTTPGVLRTAREALDTGARVLAFTTDPTSPLAAVATHTVVLPAPAKQSPDQAASRQFAGSLFEQSLLLTTDALFHTLTQLQGEEHGQLWSRHSNLE
ncbi:6-phospho-3-hexuloisomerase [Streptomyces lunalinharesii]|uniref:6-phospho-3-hexuloisomerase n=1 Tax=Streptomyces lunalinharesii TaxID=333384 RepID=A0ABP6E5Q2_9ACTN